MSHSTLTQTADSPSDSSRDSFPIVAAKFLLPSLVATTAWLFALAHLATDPASGGAEASTGPYPTLRLGFYSVTVLSVLVPVYIYRMAPRNHVDRFHSLGVQLVMFASINVVITAAFLLLWGLCVMFGVEGPLGPPITALNTVLGIIMSSIFLPGPYAGALIGRWWSN
ncbi:hypothetical protein [Haloarcula sp. JP-L23]|uniref:hypothetical protein n=1 Tax=Haloarcula sp. JP-L23 TaxID=2716717 RepID=UPI00140EF3AE|nr:hypothetical protein G9465_24480 [Haloarcula sp. JP-L23]